MKNGVTEEEVRLAIERMQAEAVFARDSLTAPARILGNALMTGQSIKDVEAWPNGSALSLLKRSTPPRDRFRKCRNGHNSPHTQQQKDKEQIMSRAQSRSTGRLHLAAGILTAVIAFTAAALPAQAIEAERVVSPGGIKAWLVRDTSVPLLSIEFRSAAAGPDPVEAGLSSLVSGLL